MSSNSFFSIENSHPIDIRKFKLFLKLGREDDEFKNRRMMVLMIIMSNVK